MKKFKEETTKGFNTLVYIGKTLWVMLIFLLGFGCLMFSIGYPRESISLRPFPYPYRAALALCSDIDQTDSVEEFIAIQKFLCTDDPTPWGKGLRLEVGNSFWFYDPTGSSSFTIFDNRDKINRYSAQVIEDFIRAGYIDVLHTYGDFTGYEFKTRHAQKAAEYFNRRGLSIPTWVNHGDRTNTQCVGRMKYQLGDNPAADEYHSYLFDSLGVKYIETFMVTHLEAMEATSGIMGMLKKAYEFLFSLKTSIQEGAIDLDWNNRLLNPFTLDDGRRILRFRRFINNDGWIPNSGVDAYYLTHQISDENLDELIDNGGYMVVYTHFGGNKPYSEWLPKQARRTLRGLSRRFQEGRLFITTTSRLLNYNLAARFLDWEWSQVDDEYRIDIKGIKNPAVPGCHAAVDELMGLTFYTPAPKKTTIYYEGQPIENLRINPIDFSGRQSVSIPWEWLTYPERY